MARIGASAYTIAHDPSTPIRRHEEEAPCLKAHTERSTPPTSRRPQSRATLGDLQEGRRKAVV
jgi:hypothetical protein